MSRSPDIYTPTDSCSSRLNCLAKLGCTGAALLPLLGLLPLAVTGILTGHTEFGIITGVYASCLIPTAGALTIYLLRKLASTRS